MFLHSVSFEGSMTQRIASIHDHVTYAIDPDEFPVELRRLETAAVNSHTAVRRGLIPVGPAVAPLREKWQDWSTR